MKKLILRFDYPPSKLLPNKKTSWREKMAVSQKVRGDAYLTGYDQGGKKGKPLEKVSMVVTWYAPSKGRMADYDGQFRAMKPIIDGGLVNAGCISDDSPAVIESVTLRYGEVDRNNPRTEIEIIPKGEG